MLLGRSAVWKFTYSEELSLYRIDCASSHFTVLIEIIKRTKQIQLENRNERVLLNSVDFMRKKMKNDLARSFNRINMVQFVLQISGSKNYPKNDIFLVNQSYSKPVFSFTVKTILLQTIYGAKPNLRKCFHT